MKRKLSTAFGVAFFAAITCVVLSCTVSVFAQQQPERKFGLLPPPPGSLESIPRLTNDQSRRRLGRLGAPASADLSPHLPPIGDQGQAGSCTSWAIAYYYKAYQENRDSDWQLEEGGWDLDELLSPAFMYNQTNDGEDRGALIRDAFTVISRMGMPNWTDMPYSDNPYSFHYSSQIDYTSLPSKATYLKAMLYRGQGFEAVFSDYPTDTDIQTIKNLLAAGEMVSFGTYVQYESSYGDFGSFNGSNHCVDQQEYNYGGHALTIVGYDDNFNGSNHGCPGASSGAFKVVNSYGANWGDDGFFWITYDGAKNNMMYGLTMTDRDDYEPTVVAEVDASHSARGYLEVTFNAGISSYVFLGDSDAIVYNGEYDTRNDLSLWVDLSDFDAAGAYPPGSNSWSIKIKNNYYYSGTLSRFDVWKSDCNLSSLDLPESLGANATTYAYVSSMQVDSITPYSYLYAASDVEITNLAGKNFCEGVEVSLTKTGQPDIVATNVEVVSSTKITCKISPAGAALGEWDVYVDNPELSIDSTLNDAFTLIDYSLFTSIPQGWSQFGVPLESAAIFPDESLGSGQYEVFQFDTTGMELLALSQSSRVSMTTAGGYWIFSEEGVASAGIIGTPVSGDSYEISLPMGCNMFSNPFLENIEWADDHAAYTCSGTPQTLPHVYSYQHDSLDYADITPGGGTDLEPWKAYWIFVREANCSLIIQK